SHYRKFTSQPQRVLAYDVAAVSTPASPPLLIGLQPDNGDKNSHLRTLTRQQTDLEKTKICT
ncbi:TPA: hypothetical protein ACIX52_005007, partial [Escherichia coli]